MHTIATLASTPDDPGRAPRRRIVRVGHAEPGATSQLRAGDAPSQTPGMGVVTEREAGARSPVVDDGRFLELCARVRLGDESAKRELFALLYDVLRRLAKRKMARRRPGHTLQATALVNEVFLKLQGKDLQLDGRSHFERLALVVMEQVLRDHDKARGRQKRPPPNRRVTQAAVEHAAALVMEHAADALALRDALAELETFDPQAARIVRLKFLEDRTTAEVAEIVGVSTRTVERDWEAARAWLRGRLRE